MVAVLVSLAAVLSACGGEDQEEATAATTKAPSIVPRGRFEKESRAICARTKEQLSKEMTDFVARRADENGETFGALGQNEAVVKVMAPSLRREIEQLEAVGLPFGDAINAEMMWQGLKVALHDLEVEGDFAARRENLFFPFRRYARHYGMRLCVVY